MNFDDLIRYQKESVARAKMHPVAHHRNKSNSNNKLPVQSASGVSA